MRQIIFDVETTGLETRDGHRIIEIGAVELINRRFTGKNYHQFINPDRVIDKEALQVHGITNEFLLDKPRFRDIAHDLMTYLKGAEIIAHNARFDVGFLNYELMLCSSPFRKVELHCQVLDTLALAKQLHPGQRNTLDALCKRYSVDNTNRTFHGALLDAELLADVYLFMTGGQATLFGDGMLEDKKRETVLSTERDATGTGALKVIYADTAELARHQTKIQQIIKMARVDLDLWG